MTFHLNNVNNVLVFLKYLWLNTSIITLKNALFNTKIAYTYNIEAFKFVIHKTIIKQYQSTNLNNN